LLSTPGIVVVVSSSLNVEALYESALALGIPKADLPTTLPALDRRLPLVGAHNFREAGGYETIDGREVVRGRIFRTDHLNELTDSDRMLIGSLGIQRVYDFRIADEIERQPSKWTASGEAPPFEIVQLGVSDSTIDTSLVDIVRDMIAGKVPLPPANFWDDNYLDMVVRAQPMFVKFIGTLTTKLPAVYHCTGGKDRTGLASALLLSLLNVPIDTIIDDFLLTNLYRTPTRLQALGDGLRKTGIDPLDAFPIIGVTRSAIERALSNIDSQHGGAANYLISGGLDPAAINALRRSLLT
jgi:protein-tyrosine phosphatase